MTGGSVLEEPEIGGEGLESSLDRAESSLASSAPEFEPGQPLAQPPQDSFEAPAPRVFNPWIIALVVTMGTFMEVLDTSIANVALPHIAGSLSPRRTRAPGF